MTQSKTVSLLVKIRCHQTMPPDELIEYVRRCLRNGGIDLSLMDLQLARIVNPEASLNVSGAVFTKKERRSEEKH